MSTTPTTTTTPSTTLRGAAKAAWLGGQARTQAARVAWEAAREAAHTTAAHLDGTEPGAYGPAVQAWAAAMTELARAREALLACPFAHRGGVKTDLTRSWGPGKKMDIYYASDRPPEAIILDLRLADWLEQQGLRALLPAPLPTDPAELGRLLTEAGI